MAAAPAVQLRELREIAEDVRAGADSLFSSLPFVAPEAIGFQINAKIAGPLGELAGWLDAHPEQEGDGAEEIDPRLTSHPHPGYEQGPDGYPRLKGEGER